MDGYFVPNFTLGTDYGKALHKFSKIPLDYHLMIGNPEDHIGSPGFLRTDDGAEMAAGIAECRKNK